MSKYAIKSDSNAWFLGWDLFEIVRNSNGFKEYKLIKSFADNKDIYCYLQKILGREVMVWKDLE